MEVLDSQLRVQDKGYSSDLVTVGRLRNSSSIKWTEVCFEVQHFDAAGKLIGAKSEKDHAMGLLPGGEHAFQISTMAGASKEQVTRAAGDAPLEHVRKGGLMTDRRGPFRAWSGDARRSRLPAVGAAA